jgi:hypothetical protein
VLREFLRKPRRRSAGAAAKPQTTAVPKPGPLPCSSFAPTHARAARVELAVPLASARDGQLP